MQDGVGPRARKALKAMVIGLERVRPVPNGGSSWAGAEPRMRDDLFPSRPSQLSRSGWFCRVCRCAGTCWYLPETSKLAIGCCESRHRSSGFVDLQVPSTSIRWAACPPQQ